MYMRKDFGKIGGARFYHPPTNKFGTSGHVKWYPESLYDPNLSKYDVTARIQGEGRLEDYQFLVGTTHFDDEDGLLYVSKEVYVGKSPVGPVILVKRAPIMKNGLVSKRYDDTPVYVEDVIRMTGAVLDTRRQESRGGDSFPADDLDLLEAELDSDPTTGGDETTPVGGCSESGFPTAERDQSSGNKVDRSVNGGACNTTPSRLCSKKPLSGELAKQNRLAIGDAHPKNSSQGPGRCKASGTWQSRLRDSTRIDYSRSRRINKNVGALAGAREHIHTAATAEEVDLDGNPLYMFKSVTDYIECHYTGELNLEALMGDPIASHMYECFMAEVGELGALLADPRTYREAMKMPDAKQWEEALRTEMKQLERLGVFSAPCPLPYGARKIKTRVILKKKRSKTGAVERWKARLVAQGFLQTFGVDFFDTYAPVARMTSFRIIYALSVYLNLFIESMDVDVAFLNATLKEDIYIEPPPGYPPVAKGMVLKLNKALYGLKQSPREWNETLDKFLREDLRMTRLKTEQCIYVRFNEDRSEYIILAVYVDDLVIAGTTQEAIMKFKQQITAKFECKDLGELDRILNMEVTRTVEGGLFLSQSLYVKDVLEKFKQYLPEKGSKFNGAETPMDSKIRLHKKGATQLRFKQKEIEVERGSVKCGESIPYREVVGSLLWLANGSRPDISFAVNQVAKYCCDPRVAHWNACKRILRYLSTTQDYGILYSSVNTDVTSKDMKNMPLPTAYFASKRPRDVDVSLESYVDADFANCIDDRHSISGYAFLLAGGPISWQSRSQPTVALSTMEAEYMAAATATQEAFWLRFLLEELGLNVSTPIVLKEDNKACISFSDHPGNHRNSKHIDYRHHFVREGVQRGDISMEYIETKFQLADIFTKALDTITFIKFRDMLVVSASTLNLVVKKAKETKASESEEPAQKKQRK